MISVFIPKKILYLYFRRLLKEPSLGLLRVPARLPMVMLKIGRQLLVLKLPMLIFSNTKMVLALHI